MNTNDKKSRLIKTAEELPPFSTEAFEEYNSKIPELVNKLNLLMQWLFRRKMKL
jgi:hypothetical protein